VQIAVIHVFGPQMFDSIQSSKATVIHSLSFHSLCSKCLPLAFTHTLSRQRHCLMAESMRDWSSRSHSSTVSSGTSLTSWTFFTTHFLASFSRFCQETF